MNSSALHALNQIIITAEGGSDNMIGAVLTTVIVFLFVIWILKEYAFDPVLSIIDERRDKIAGDLKKAEDLQQQAAAEKAELDERLRTIENVAREKMQELIAEGKVIAKSIQEKAHQEAEVMKEKARKSIQAETEKARVELKHEIIKLTLMATERIIHEKLDDEKHQSLINNFLSEVERN